MTCASLLACDGLLAVDFDDARARAMNGTDASAGDTTAPVPIEPDVPLVPADKVDLLFVVDNSSSMGDKSKLLAASIGTLIRDIASRVRDMHVGVISSSLGSFGGNVCDPTNPRTNDQAHLRNVDETGALVPGADSGVLTYQNGDIDAFVTNAAAMVRGVGESGCGFEAPLEAMYRFLVQPDPWVQVKLDGNNLADLGTDVDITVLQQRRAFLRPDSALIVVLITDEDDSGVDPLSVGGQGWAFMGTEFPGSKVQRGVRQGTTAPRGTSICATNPASADCTSCGFQALCDPQKPECQKIKNDPNCRKPGTNGGEGFDGYYGPTEDDLNVRFHRMKERYGVDPQYPLSRYVDGFTRFKIPNREGEHSIVTTAGRREIAEYAPVYRCTNPLFAASLPSQVGDELCALPPGARSRQLVLFTVLGGLPEALATASPDWDKIVGRDPDTYDLAGIDPHMIQSAAPRVGLATTTGAIGDNGSDPIHGGDWNTGSHDLEYACTFALSTPRTCTAGEPSCECATDGRTVFPPLCAAGDQQVRAKAYPTPRPLRVAKGLGERGVLGSLCANRGYEVTMRTLGARLAPRLAN